MMIGITSYGAYVPLWRIKREAIIPGGVGEKSVAHFDEDTLTMAVSAAINSIAGLDRDKMDGLLFASTTFPYKEKQNASIVAAATDLRKDILTLDIANTLRGGTNGVKMGVNLIEGGSARNVIVVASDCRLGTPGSSFEQTCGDGAGALVIGSTDVAVEIEGSHSVYNEMVDVWRADEDRFIRSWDERFVQSEGYMNTVLNTTMALMKKRGLGPKDFHKAVIYAPEQRRMEELAIRLGFDLKTQVQNPLISRIGNTGTASPLMVLIAALEDSKPGDKILWISYGDGCDAIILKVTEQIEKLKGKKGIGKFLESKQHIKDYITYLEWKGILKRERGPGKPPQEVSLSALRRDWEEVVRFYASKCKSCGTIQYPPQRVCTECHAKDQLEKVRLSDHKGKLFTFSLDSISDPLDTSMVLSVIDFDCGGRAVLTMTDHSAKEIKISMAVEMSFRKLFFNEGIHNYFWKCVPSRIS
jgi:3-hydroxy-3-methylglutaryl CoA synthase